jgi:hypothetical protein
MTLATTVGVNGRQRWATTWVMMWAMMWARGTMAAMTPATTPAKGMVGMLPGRGGGGFLAEETAMAAVVTAAAAAAAYCWGHFLFMYLYTGYLRYSTNVEFPNYSPSFY